MYKFNYSKMNRVLDDITIKLKIENNIENTINMFGGALCFFEDSINKADNLTPKLIIDYENYFYKELYMLSLKTNNLMLTCSISDTIINKLNKKLTKKKNNVYFNLMIDMLMLNALSFVRNNIVNGAKDYFTRAIFLGEKYLNDSKKNYHDSICCAYSWLGYIYYKENDCKKSLEHYERALTLYNSVKDNNGFYYKEYNPKDIEIRVDELKKILNN